METTKTNLKNAIADFTFNTWEGILIPVSLNQRRLGIAFELLVGDTTVLIKEGAVAERMRKLEGAEVKITGILHSVQGRGDQMTPVFYRPVRYTDKANATIPKGLFPVEDEAGQPIFAS